MYNNLFYIFTFFIVISVLLISFKSSSYKLFFYLSLMLAGYSGYFLLLNFGFISAVLALLLIIAGSLITFGRKYLIKIPSESQNEIKMSLFSAIIISLLTALIAGLPGTAKWQKFDIDYITNNFSAVFGIYLPVFIAGALLVSVIISTALKLFIPGRAEH